MVFWPCVRLTIHMGWHSIVTEFWRMFMSRISIPSYGEPIRYHDGAMVVPDQPIVLYIEGDGIGVDITPVMQKVVDAAVDRAYGGSKKIAWAEVYCGEKANRIYGKDIWLPDETIKAIEDYHVAIKGPLTTPIGGGIRSLNVALRQKLDLYVCLRPIQYFEGTPTPLKDPHKTHITIFRENSEDIYAGIEFEAQSTHAVSLIQILQEKFGVEGIRFPDTSGVGVKIISEEGSKRLIRQAIDYAINHPYHKSVTLVHKGNIMKFTEGSFRDWGYELAREEFGAEPMDGGPWHVIKQPGLGDDIIIKDVIADAFLQQIILRPEDYDVVATMNLNGDYISDALAAQVGGIGISPGANIGDKHALFEATHGTAPKYAGQDKVNPSSLILSAEMMLRHLHWDDAADLVINGLKESIRKKQVTYDFARFMEGIEPLSSSTYGDAIIDNMAVKVEE